MGIEDGNQRDNALSASCAVLTPPTRLSDLLSEIQAHLSSSTIELPTYSPRVFAAINYLGDHYADASLRRLGRAVGAAPYYLSTLFRAETGMSLRSYINQLHIEAAKWLLLETGEKIETVAARIGLHDASHLSRLFLKHTGNRPGAYRRQQAGDDGAKASSPKTAIRDPH